ncbi:hypothetical protein ACHHYP_15193 [Achlya hypogyna]|uniref:RanBP2-type domain-containing protein n=1 Tax=Achlya hypogyna TaxID=1202772 RepID=A0A1V9YB78_ACHHY|nr:hypothetical protein ACHHYP_15193 [Achlya hypogyna]
MSLAVWEDWACPRCSLINEPDCAVCDACGLDRPAAHAADPMAAFFNIALAASAGTKRGNDDVVDLASSDDDESDKKEEHRPTKLRKTSPAGAPPTDEVAASAPAVGAVTETSSGATAPPLVFKVASLNVWFDEVLVADRVRCMVHTIGKLQPHVVFLQEVTPDMCQLFKTRMAHIGFISPCTVDEAYGEMIFHLRQLPMLEYSRVPFERSSMGRGLHTLVTTVGGRRLVVATAHLESLATNQLVRREQLDWSFARLSAAHPAWIFGGDMNLGNRDKPALPDDVLDAWVACGSDPAHQHTWDTSVNKNLPGVTFKAKCRFDRIYSRGMTPTSFATFGKEVLPTDSTLYPSDHWGIVATYDLAT